MDSLHFLITLVIGLLVAVGIKWLGLLVFHREFTGSIAAITIAISEIVTFYVDPLLATLSPDVTSLIIKIAAIVIIILAGFGLSQVPSQTSGARFR